MTKRTATTRINLPGRTLDAHHDDTEPAADYDDALALDLLDAADEYDRQHPDLVPGGPSLSASGTHSPHVSFRVPIELAEQLDERSAAERLSRSVLARRALTAYLGAARRTQVES